MIIKYLKRLTVWWDLCRSKMSNNNTNSALRKRSVLLEDSNLKVDYSKLKCILNKP